MSGILGPDGQELPEFGHDPIECSANSCEGHVSWKLDGNPMIPIEHRATLYLCDKHFDAIGRPKEAVGLD